ncbi:MAG: arylesterase [Microscillaceae bacterium]|nr:arylesterase [Microscillaceae bacterium]
MQGWLFYFYSLLFGISFLLWACQDSNTTNAEKAAAQDASAGTASAKQAPANIVFFGNSLTAGYGLDPEEAFPALIQQWIDSLGYSYQAVNAGLSGETTAGGVARIDWILKQPVAVFVLELGGNDGLRGLAPEETEKNLRLIIQKVKKKYPQAPILLTGMEAPPNMGRAYTEAFRAVFARVAEAEKTAFLRFLLEGVAGEAALNQADGIHPTALGQRRVAQNVWKVLMPLLLKPKS